MFLRLSWHYFKVKRRLLESNGAWTKHAYLDGGFCRWLFKQKVVKDHSKNVILSAYFPRRIFLCLSLPSRYPSNLYSNGIEIWFFRIYVILCQMFHRRVPEVWTGHSWFPSDWGVEGVVGCPFTMTKNSIISILKSSNLQKMKTENDKLVILMQ